MRAWVFVAAGAALVATTPPGTLRGVAATAASALVEAVPLLLASAIVARALGGGAATAYLGCGCGTGPSARSIPAAAVAWLVFGPTVACARLLAGTLAARLVRGAPHRSGETHAGILDQLRALVPAALLAGAAAPLSAALDLAHLAPPVQLLCGALLGLLSAPCGLGAVAVAGSLHARAPLAAAGFLCVAGIADLRALAIARTHAHGGHDGGAYACLGLALAIVALRRGDALVHPALTPAILACAAAAIALALLHRRARNATAYLAPAIVLAGAFAHAPPPDYRVTETTMRDLFDGERIAFTGMQVRRGTDAALVRYAILCCRADAAPVVVRLTRPLSYARDAWLRVDGTIEGPPGDLRLAPVRAEQVSPPADPFIYR